MEFYNKNDKKLIAMHQGHRHRLRERLVKLQYNAPEHEVLEYVLQQPIKRKDTNELAHKLLLHFGSFANVCDASVEELKNIEGVGDSTAYFLNSLPYLFTFYKSGKSTTKPHITCMQDVYDYLGETIMHLPKEQFYAICLNSHSMVINHKNISAGDGSAVAFNLNDVANFCKSLNASQVILLHNHPTGSEFPSKEDIDATRMLYFNLKANGIELCEHIIINYEGKMYSFSKNNRVEGFKSDWDNMFKN